MADATPDKGAQPPAADATTPARQLNANAKSFVPRLETTPKANNNSGRSNNKSSNQQAAGAGAAPVPSAPAGPASAAGVASVPPPNARGHPIPPILAPPLGIPPMAPLGLGPLGLVPPGLINPLMMSPLLMAAAMTRVPQFVTPLTPLTAAAAAAAASSVASAAAAAAAITPTNAPPVNVNVGNASLQALRASGPNKFACVLIVGMPRVGKTTIGRNLVKQLDSDGLNWSFFSGGDYIKDGSRAAPWDVTRDIFDGLAAKLDDLQAQPPHTVRGLIIDKQCRGTEELYYLTALLRSKGLHLNGVVGLVADDDTKLMDRLGETDPAFKEKCKFHRVIQTRIREACKTVGLWHPVDALDDPDTIVRKIRSMVLGCSSQNPHKQLTPSMYHEAQSPMVDNYETYVNVMNTLTNLTRAPKPTHFPGFTNFTPLSTAAMAKKSQFKDYAVRRRSDGTKYCLVYDGTAMYLVPRHMRCVFSLRLEAWLGIPLNTVSKFVLDGDMVRLSKERNREKFLVQDVLCWMERGSTANAVNRSNWKERQEKLTVNICGEDSAFFGNSSEVVVVHQTFVDFKNTDKLFEATDYPTDGFVFQPTLKRDDPVYSWRPPETTTVDFRLGPVVSPGATEGTKKYSLQVFDVKLAKFVAYGTDTVTISDTRQFVVEGALAICSLKPDEAAKLEGREWTYVRTRTDISTCAFKSYVDDLLSNCLISKANVCAFLGVDPTQPRPTPAPSPATTAQATAPSSQQPSPSAPSPNSATAVPAPSFQRGAFGSALPTDSPPPAAVPATAVSSTIAALTTIVSNVHHVPGNVTPGAPSITATAPPVAGRKPRGPTPADVAAKEAVPKPRSPPPQAAPAARKQRCWGCGNVGEGDVDCGDHKFYCLDCWAAFEQQADKGKRDNNNRRGANNKPRAEAKPAPQAEGVATEQATATGDGENPSRRKTRRGGGGTKKDPKSSDAAEPVEATA